MTLFATKPIERIMSESEGGEHTLKRTLTASSLIALGIGASEIFAWIIGWDLTLEYAMGASTVSSGWSNHFIELLDIFHMKIPLWLAYDHWTALRTAEGTIARHMAQGSDASLVPGSQAFLSVKPRPAPLTLFMVSART